MYPSLTDKPTPESRIMFEQIRDGYSVTIKRKDLIPDEWKVGSLLDRAVKSLTKSIKKNRKKFWKSQNLLIK